MKPMAAFDFEVSHPIITKLELEVFNLHLTGKFEGLCFYLIPPTNIPRLQQLNDGEDKIYAAFHTANDRYSGNDR